MYKALLPLLLVTIPVLAQPIYSYRDDSGNIVYTNQQPPANTNVKQVKLPKVQTISNAQLKGQLNTENSAARSDKQATTVTEVFIQGIPSEEALRANDGTFSVTIVLDTANKALPPSYQYLLLLDGKIYGTGPQASPYFTLTNLERGNHTLQAQISNNGQIIARSSIQSFTLQRAHRKITPKPKPRI